ncbi:RHS repeat-associated core domain-containing protein [Microtetraspora niveoalba]|uniref:RHS repeat-associated core domain-containing protein n=1 Tax=Microtetraspora niveoalba TaxID=46175 RepID=UPI0012FB3E91|nr:RHS repeat-associated core domain-containing protein [Microtetraspora niveoalba]
MTVVFGLSVSGVGVPDGLVQQAAAETRAAEPERSVEGRPIQSKPVPKGAEDVQPPLKRAEPVWPKAGVGRVDLEGKEPVAVAGLPVSVARAKAAGASTGSKVKAKAAGQESPSSVQVEMLDGSVTRRLGGVGIAVRVTRADGGTVAAPTDITLNYSSFRDAYPGGFASRLVLRELPACALVTPVGQECAKKAWRRIPVINDVKVGTVTAEVTAAPQPAAADGSGVGSASASSASDSGDGSVYVLAASASTTSSDLTGSFAATDLKPSGTWQVGLSGGSFSYSIPITVPPAPGGQAPKLSLDYSSATVDSLTGYTNNQAGWVGLGWDLGAGFIERRYKPCTLNDKDDGPRRLCWDVNNDLTLSVAGRSSRIVKDATSGTSGSWRTVEDYGWKIEQVAASTDPANSSQPYWKVTTQDGTVYRFGFHRDSSFQVPYIARAAGSPCYDKITSPWPWLPTFCVGTWRWMLDQEIDPKGNIIDYAYAREQNNFCLYSGDSCRLYDRGGYLAEVTYGSNANVAGSAPTARVVFTTVDRNQPIPGGTWWDAPLDLLCEDSTLPLCTDSDGPSFFIKRRLSTILTQTRNTATNGWDDVTRLELGYRWIQTSPGETFSKPVLWLDTVRQVGLAGGGPGIPLPPIQLDATLLASGPIADQFPRITAVGNGLGGRTEITYGQPSGCNLAARTKANVRDRAGYDCYWAFRGEYNDGVSTYVEGNVYNKWLVTKVADKDLVAGSPDVVTRYEYVGSPAWARTPEFGETPDVYKIQDPFPCWGFPGFPKDCSTTWDSWTEWRGYPTVRVIKGDGSDPAGYSVTSSTFYRGLYDDVFSDGTPKRVQVTDFDNNTFDDLRVLSGRTLQEQTWHATGWNAPTPICKSPAWSATASYPANWPVSYNGHEWWAIAPSKGKAPAPGSTYWSDQGACPIYTSGLTGYAEDASTRYEYVRVVTGDGPGIADPIQINTSRQVTREKVSSGWRYSETKIEYNADGLPTKVNDYGERGVAADNACSTTTYARNTDSGHWITSLPSVLETRKGDDCSGGEVIGRTVTLYDGGADPATNKPVRGNKTEVRNWIDATHVATEKSDFDGYGRQTSITDVRGKTTGISYSPAVGYPVNGITRTNPLGYVQTAWPSSAHGGIVGMRDANNRMTNVDYDALGRTVTLWTPGQPKSGGTPAAKITYNIPFDGSLGQPISPANVRIDKLISGQGVSVKWVSSVSFEDGNGRLREEQMPSPTGGRMVKITSYDARGLEVIKSAPIYNSATAGSGLLNPALSDLPSWTKTVFDGLGRQTAKIEYGGANEVRRSTTEYVGMDTYTVIPPLGGRTSYTTNHSGKITKISEQVGSQWLDSLREYDLRGNLIKTVDANGNVRTFTYDWAKRRTASTDPDFGAATATYDLAGNLVAATDAKGVTVSTVYDDLGRKIEQWEGTPGSGTKLAEWIYDTLVKGQLTSATRWTDGHPYTDAVTAYDADNRPIGSTLTIPSVEGPLAGTYTFEAGYDKTGREVTKKLPAAGGLPAETITATTNDVGLPAALTSDFGGGFTYVKETAYSPTGKLLSRSLGASGQVRRTMTWDPATSRITAIKTVSTSSGGSSATLQDDVFSYDVAGSLTSIVDKTTTVGGTTIPQAECFTYDERRRLAAAFTTTGTCMAGASGAGPDPYDLAYTFDPVGNIKSITDSGQTSTFNYPNPGAAAVRPNAVTSITRPAGTDTYTYDARGQLISQAVSGQTATYEWNPIGQLAKATTGTSTQMVYDANGNRLVRREVGKTVLYLGLMELEVANGQVTARRYYKTADGTTVAMRTGGQTTVTWLLAGPAGSTELSIDDATREVSHQKYLPFGGRRGGRDDLAGTDRGFLGKIEDDSTGLVNLDARYYSPAIGRFISTDPMLGNDKPELANPYSYSGNDPVNFADPTGLYPERLDVPLTCLKGDPDCPINPLSQIADSRSTGVADESGKESRDLLSEMNGNNGMLAAAVAKKGPGIGVWNGFGEIFELCKGINNADCVKVAWISNKAQRMTNTFLKGDGCKKGKPCKANAMRHCIWQVAITDQCGLEVAQRVAENHEQGNDLSDPKVRSDTERDRHNNAVAQEWSQLWKPKFNAIRKGPGSVREKNNRYWAQVKRLCEMLWNSGELW